MTDKEKKVKAYDETLKKNGKECHILSNQIIMNIFFS